MNFLIIIAVILALFLIVELLKHQFTKNIFKYFIVLIIIIVTLLVISAYIDLGDLIGKDSTFSKTGAVIVDGISDDTSSIKESETVNVISDKVGELFNNIIDN
ncbi:hypothetical protein J4467_03120 [Candidatus Woesearchaeota archaeon]|nr:hypothetical protein [Candidatus Woesearchaeota archaeon]